MPLFYKRITLVVADLERSLKVYRDILGFTINSIEPSDDESYSYPVFRIPKDAKITFATLDGPDQNRTLGLTEVTGCELPKNSGIHMSASVIQVANLGSVIEQIKSLGLETTKPTTDTGDNFSFKEQAFVDYDGHLVVLYEIT